MGDTSYRRVPASFKDLKLRGDLQMADARQAVADAHRISSEVAQLRAETARLHARFHARAKEDS